MNKKVNLHVDIDDYKSPTIITGPSQRHCVAIFDVNKLYIIELTVGMETWITINTERKKEIMNSYVEDLVTIATTLVISQLEL